MPNVIGFNTGAATTIDYQKTGPQLNDPWAIINAITSDNRRACVQKGAATGTTQATAFQIPIPPSFIEITSATSGSATGIALDVSNPGARITVANNSGTTITIYTSPNETIYNTSVVTPKINGTAGSTGVTLANGSSAVFVCAAVGQWYRISGS